MNPVRVRFAPSPTGPLHIGGVRTALYNYLFARKHGGSFILRIEDTDQTRFVSGAERYIMDSLKWCGITIDEGIEEGGEYGPYRQSDRKHLYRQYAEALIEGGYAYYAFDTPEEIDSLRKKLEEQKASNTSYSAAVRNEMKNSLSLPKEKVDELLNNGSAFVIRFKMPLNEDVEMIDLIRGKVVVNTSTLDDKVLFKSDGMPTYHLANVVDDYLMKISHVIRGEEWLPSLALHVLLYRSFGWEKDMPEFAHLPLLLKPSGQGKLSKRDGDKLGFPVFPLEWKDPSSGELSRGYREDGYFPEAFVNLLAFLGWNPGTEQEIFSIEGLVEAFSIERVSKSGAHFDPVKAKSFNHQYMATISAERIADQFRAMFPVTAGVTDEFLTKVIDLVKERADLIPDIWDQSSFFFEAPASYDEKFMEKKWKDESAAILRKVADVLNTVDPYTRDNIEAGIKGFIEKEGLSFGQVMPPLRVAMVGSPSGPDMMEILSLLGKQEVIKRIEAILTRG